MRRKLIVITFVVVAAASAIARAGNLDIVKGKLINDEWTKQLLTVKNNTTVNFLFVEVECGFFRGDTLVAVGSAAVGNLEAGHAAYTEIVALVPDANHTDCRIGGKQEDGEK